MEIYLAQARSSGFRLILDIQPGRSTFNAEVAWLSDMSHTVNVWLPVDQFLFPDELTEPLY